MKGNCVVQAVGSAMEHLHETVEDEFGGVLAYASETTQKYLHPNNLSIMSEVDIRAKHLVQATTLEFVFPEKDVADFEPVEWLSNSTYMPYFNAFMTGLDLNTTFSFAGECIGNSVGFVDKTV